MASEIGRMRHLASIKQGRSDNYGYSGLGWSEHIEGACGEMAVAKALGRYWDGGVDRFARPDVGRLEVKTRSRDDYELIVRPGDDESLRYVLVTGRCPEYVIRGWIDGKEARREEYLASHGGRPPAFFVPHVALRPISEIGEY